MSRSLIQDITIETHISLLQICLVTVCRFGKISDYKLLNELIASKQLTMFNQSVITFYEYIENHLIKVLRFVLLLLLLLL